MLVASAARHCRAHTTRVGGPAVAASSYPKRFLRVPGPLVDVDWLAQFVDEHGSHSGLSVLDATWYLPTDSRDAYADFERGRIPGAVFFDLDAASDTSSNMPHMMPPLDLFARRCEQAGIGDGDAVVVYDAPRIAFMFEAFGYANVTVLDGGLPAWKTAGLPVESGAPPAPLPPKRAILVSNEVTNSMVVSIEQVIANLEEAPDQRRPLVDARSRERFDGDAPEPRPIPAGHIVGSVNLPFQDLLTADGLLKPADQLRRVLEHSGAQLVPVDPDATDTGAASRPDNAPIALCGSGVTACILALAYRVAFPRGGKMPVYDGSWTEWATTITAPQLKEFSKRVQNLADSVQSSSPVKQELAAIAEAARNHEFKAAYSFFELVYREEAGLSDVVPEDSDVLATCLELARTLTQPPVSLPGEDGMTVEKRIGLGRKL